MHKYCKVWIQAKATIQCLPEERGLQIDRILQLVYLMSPHSLSGALIWAMLISTFAFLFYQA